MEFTSRRKHRQTPHVPTLLATPSGGATIVKKRPLGSYSAPRRPEAVTPKPIAFDLELPKDELQEAFTLRRSRTSTPFRTLIKSAAVYGALIALALVVGISFYNQSIGQWVVVAAGIAAVIFRLKSSLILVAATFVLGMVVLLTLIGQPALASNYAVYAYILLGFGTFNSIFYLRGSERRIAV